MKKILIILIILVLSGSLIFKLTENKMKPVFKSQEVQDGSIYVQECLLTGLFFISDDEAIYPYIKNGEIYFDKVNIKTKNTENLNKISREEIGYLRISTPYIVSNPAFYHYDDKILIAFNGKTDTAPKGKIILYDISNNTYKDIPLKHITGGFKHYDILKDGKIFFSEKKDKNFKIEYFDTKTNTLVKGPSAFNADYASLEPLDNARALVLDTWEKIKGVYNIKTGRIEKFLPEEKGQITNYIKLQNGNLVLEIKKDKGCSLEIFDVNKNSVRPLYSSNERIKINYVLGDFKFENYLYADINDKPYSISLIDGKAAEIEIPAGKSASFPLFLGNDKILLNKVKGAKILDLKTGKIIKQGKITTWPGSYTYPLNSDETILINPLTEKTTIINNKTDKFKNGPKLNGRFYHTLPHQIIRLKDGKYMFRYTETQSTIERGFGYFGKPINMFMISACDGKEGLICQKFNKLPHYSFVVTEISE